MYRQVDLNRVDTTQATDGREKKTTTKNKKTKTKRGQVPA